MLSADGLTFFSVAVLGGVPDQGFGRHPDGDVVASTRPVFPLYSGTSPLSLKHSGLGAVAPNRGTHPIGQRETSDLGHLLVLVPSHAQMAKRVLRGTTFTPGILGF